MRLYEIDRENIEGLFRSVQNRFPVCFEFPNEMSVIDITTAIRGSSSLSSGVLFSLDRGKNKFAFGVIDRDLTDIETISIGLRSANIKLLAHDSNSASGYSEYLDEPEKWCDTHVRPFFHGIETGVI